MPDVVQAALEYASYGWQVIPLYGSPQQDVCECQRRGNCKSAGKHPRIKSWQSNATADETQIGEWFDKWPGSNLGIMLGPRSGIVDVEYDSEEGRITAQDLLGDCFTPSYKSQRSVHRLFQWSEALPNVDTDDGIIKIKGLELRLGHRQKGFQSVFPPSTHSSGVQYQWLEGLSPGECELQEIPDELFAWIQAWVETNGHPEQLVKSKKREFLYQTHKIIEGDDGRNDTL